MTPASMARGAQSVIRHPLFCGALRVVILGMLATAVESQAQPVFRGGTNAVRIDALVTDQGRIVRGLAAEDFEVIDAGVRQSVEFASLETLPLTVTLVLDTSGSGVGERFAHLRAAGHAVLNGLRSGDRSRLLTFSDRVTEAYPLTADTDRLRARLGSVIPGGETSLYDGAYVAATLGGTTTRDTDAGREETARHLVLLFSDGLDTASWLSPKRVVAAARRSEAIVYAVTVRGSGSLPFLQELTHQTGGAVVEIDSSRDIEQRFVDILDEFRQRYVLSYTPQGVSASGWHPLSIRVKSRGATVRARLGYEAR